MITVKSRYLVQTMVTVFGLLLAMSSAFAVDEPPGLVGRWDFDDGTGKDLSGNGNNAQLGNAEVYALGDGKRCIMLMPDTGPIQIPATEDSRLALKRGTVSLWLNVGWSDSTYVLDSSNQALRFRLYRRHLMPRFISEDGFKYRDFLGLDWTNYDMRDNAFYPHPDAAVHDAQWHMLTLAYDDLGRRIIGWRDGQLIHVADLSAIDMKPLKREGFEGYATGKGFVGFIDDLRIYDRILSDGEVRRMYDSTYATYEGRRDMNPQDKKLEIYNFREEDRTLYNAWLQHSPITDPGGTDILKRIVVESKNSTVENAAVELSAAVESALGFKPSTVRAPTSDPQVILGTAETSSWIRRHADKLSLDRIEDDGFVIKSIDDGGKKTLVIAGAVPAGVIFGTFDLIRRIETGQDPIDLDVLENPNVPIRMINHWSSFRGSLGDDWRGGDFNSIYSWEELRTGDTKRIRDWVRLLASAGWNGICPSNINWDYRNNYLDHLDEVETLAGILRDFGMRLYWSPSYMLALKQETADQLYARVPDFGGYMLKMSSEAQYGNPRPPMVNRIADTLAPYGGHCLLRTFTYTSRLGGVRYVNILPHNTYAHEDGNYRRNVVLMPKGSHVDWDFWAPMSSLEGAFQKNLSGSELCVDKIWPASWIEKWKWWFQQDHYYKGPGSLNKFDVDCIMGVAMMETAPAWTTTPLNMVNYYGLGRLAWNPDLAVAEIYDDWAQQTFGNDPQVVDTVTRILLISDDVIRKLYQYRGYRGTFVMEANSKVPYSMSERGMGTSTPELGAQILQQYAPGLREVYGDPLRNEEFLAAFQVVDHDHRLSIGRTLIEDTFANLDEAIELAQQMLQLWESLEGKIDDHRYRYMRQALVMHVEETQSIRGNTSARIEELTGRNREEVLARLTSDELVRAGTYNVRHFGAVADGVTNDAPAINKTIDVCNEAGGGTVHVPTGIYAVGSIHLKSNVKLALDAGAVLQASAGAIDPRERNPNDQGLINSAAYYWEASLIWGKDLENVKIYGPGTINGSALTRSNKVPAGIGDKAIALRGCKNVEIRNLNINEGGHRAILATACQDVLIDNVTINTSRSAINLSQCSDVEIAFCHIDAVRYEDGVPVGGGDAIKLSSDLSLGNVTASKNVSVHDCFLAAGGHGLLFGSETVGPLQDYRFENIRIRHAGMAGIGITSNDGSLIDGVLFKGISMQKTYAPIFIKLSDIARVPEGTYQRGAIRNVTFENITVTESYSELAGGATSAMIWGKPDTPIENIIFKNVSIVASGGHPVTDAELKPPNNNAKRPRAVGTLPAYACYLRHVNGVRITDCEFGFEQPAGRPALVINGGARVALKNVLMPISSECSARVAIRHTAEKFSMERCASLPDVTGDISDTEY